MSSKQESDTPDKESITDSPESWVDEHGDYLYNFAYSRVHDETAAQDVVQETFLAALKGRDSFSGASSRRTWLVGILKHKIIDHFRRVAREQAGSDDELLPIEKDPIFNPDGEWAGHWVYHRGPTQWKVDPDRLYEEKEFREVFDLCLEQLPARMAAAFTLSIVESRPSDDVCKELAVTPTNLWTMLSRARQQLRLCLETHWLKGRAH